MMPYNGYWYHEVGTKPDYPFNPYAVSYDRFGELCKSHGLSQVDPDAYEKLQAKHTITTTTAAERSAKYEAIVSQRDVKIAYVEKSLMFEATKEDIEYIADHITDEEYEYFKLAWHTLAHPRVNPVVEVQGRFPWRDIGEVVLRLVAIVVAVWLVASLIRWIF